MQYNNYHQRLCAIEDFNLFELWTPNELDMIVSEWLCNRMKKYHCDYRKATIALRKRFRKVVKGLSIRWRDGSFVLVRKKIWWKVVKPRCSVVVKRLVKLGKYIAAVEDTVGDLGDVNPLVCNRASSWCVKSRRRQAVGCSETIFQASSSNGSGLVSHLKFWTTILKRRSNLLCFPSRTRLGRESWRGAVRVLETCGIGCRFGTAGEGVGAGRRASSKVAVQEAVALEGCLFLPSGWVGSGWPVVGSVAVVSGCRSVVESCVVFPGRDFGAVAAALLVTRLLGRGVVRFGAWAHHASVVFGRWRAPLGAFTALPFVSADRLVLVRKARLLSRSGGCF